MTTKADFTIGYCKGNKSYAILKAGSVEKNLLCSILLLNKCNKRQLSLRSENVNRFTQLPNKAVFKGQAKTYTRVTAKCNDVIA